MKLKRLEGLLWGRPSSPTPRWSWSSTPRPLSRVSWVMTSSSVPDRERAPSPSYEVSC